MSRAVARASGTSFGLREQLMDEEGVVPYAYKDHLGYLTIGCGRLIDKRKGGRLRPDEIALLLDNDIEEKTQEVEKALPWVRELDEPRRAVVVGMAFQMGTAGLLKFKNTLRAVTDGRWQDAHDGMLASKWAEQTPARAKRMARQMLTGEWQRKSR